MRQLCVAIGISLFITTVALVSRPLLPIDETRYVGVAWDAYCHGDWLVSHKNGETYAHKPPLLFWLINAVWYLGGVSDWGARLVGPLAGLACLPLVRWLSRQLWPNDHQTAAFVPLVLATMAPWMLFAPLTMFDTLLTLATLLGLSGVLLAAQGLWWRGWLLMGIGAGMGILTKGPVIFVHILPVALLAIWWRFPRGATTKTGSNIGWQDPSVTSGLWWRWYSGALFGTLIAAFIGLSWAIPSAISGGQAYADELLLGQTTGRVVRSFSHRHHLLWYLPLLPLCGLPWIGLGIFWKGLRVYQGDWALRFLLSWIGGSLLILSLISGKQIHYLIPMFPALALLIARCLSLAPAKVNSKDLWLVATGTIVIGCLPLAFNHVSALSKLGLAGIVPDVFVPALAVVGALIWLGRQWSVEKLVPRLAGLSALATSLMIAAGTLQFWPGFDMEPLANYVAAQSRPVLWYGEYHAQLNFAGKLKHIDVAYTPAELEKWVSRHPDGLLLTRLLGEGPEWKEFVAAGQQQTDQDPSAEQVQLIQRVMAGKPELAAYARATPISVYWIRQGLFKKPHITFCRDAALTADASHSRH